MNDQFELYDLEVTVGGDERTYVCAHSKGKAFLVIGENLVFTGGQFSLYALASLLPLLPAKQRHTDANDWMTTDEYIACPDPHCGAKFRITRLGLRKFNHSDVTNVELRK